ncbi:MAG: hypothetical protein HQ511_02970 [Rhodospirillales bacterium]|nr:hypothetical protein [Rhodospirillales bacterium]
MFYFIGGAEQGHRRVLGAGIIREPEMGRDFAQGRVVCVGRQRDKGQAAELDFGGVPADLMEIRRPLASTNRVPRRFTLGCGSPCG